MRDVAGFHAALADETSLRLLCLIEGGEVCVCHLQGVLKTNQPKISRLLRGQLSGFSTERLMRFLTLLGRDVEIVIKRAPRSRRQGRLRVIATA